MPDFLLKRRKKLSNDASYALSIFFLFLFLILVSTSSTAPTVPTSMHAPSFLESSSASIPSNPKPSTSSQSPNQVSVNALYSSEPAPMGIADYGIGSIGAYRYSTKSFLGIAQVYSLSTQNSTGGTAMSFQLNLVLQFTSQEGQQFVYWVQNVAEYYSSSSGIYFENNVWNLSSRKATMLSGVVSGSGKVYNYSGTAYYASVASSFLPGNEVYLTVPISLQFEVNSSLDSLGHPEVTFAYNDGFGWQTYDTVIFPLVTNPLVDNGFVVDGNQYNPYGTFYDVELVMVGECCGWSTTLVQSNVFLQLQYWNGYNYQEIYNAYNFGSDTAEGISNALSQGSYFYANGSLVARVSAGAGSLGKLYDRSQVAIVSLQSTLNSGTLYVVNASSTYGKGAGYLFTGGNVNVTMSPGNYIFYLYDSNGALFAQQSQLVTAGQYLSLHFASASQIVLTLSYTVTGGGTAFSAATVSYQLNGQRKIATLNTLPTSYFMDKGSTWSITNIIAGSSTNERWASGQASNGTALTTQTIVFNYNHQYQISFGVNPSGAGSVSPSSTGWYDAGASVSISAAANSPNFFSSWTATQSITITNPHSSSTTATVNGAGTITANFPAISLSLNSTSGTISQGSSVTLTATVSGGGQTANLIVTGLPSGATATWSANPITPTSSGLQDSLVIRTDFTTSAGNYPLTIFASTGSNNVSSGYTLTVRQTIALTLSYSVQGGGSGYSVPSISYTYDGSTSLSALSNTPTTIHVDENSLWSATTILSGSSSAERWQIGVSVGGSATSSTTTNLVYYHQFLTTFNFTILGGGSSYTPPRISYVKFGVNLSTAPIVAVWADSGTRFSYTNPLGGSNHMERWQANSSSGVDLVTTSSTVNLTFYHQFPINASFSINNGGSPSSPILVFVTYGAGNSSNLTGTPTTFWADAESNFSISNPSASSSSKERWITNSSTIGVASSQVSLNPDYVHQYYVEVKTGTTSGGSVSPASGWINAGESLVISTVANAGWKFEYWNGTGVGSYAGIANTTSLKVESPIVETAAFYPAIIVASGNGGDVSYVYASASGTVHEGETLTLYVPVGTSISLTSSPSSLLYQLDYWTGPTIGNSSQTSVSISSPSIVQAHFGHNFATIGGIAAILIVALSTLLLLRRRHHAQTLPPPP